MGLGLAICKAIVDAHGGTIKVTNKSTGGEIFSIVMPCTESPPTVEAEITTSTVNIYAHDS